MKILLILLSLIATACATAYGPMGSQGGYEDRKIQDGVYYVHFASNARTSKEVTEKYLLRRAGELCSQDGYGYFFPAIAQDRTSQTVSHETSTYVAPTYTNGNAYAYGGNGYASGSWNSTTTGGDAYTSSYDVVNTFPNIEGIFVCYNTPKRPGIGVEITQISPDLMAQNGIKDGLPGFTVQRLAAESDGIKLQPGDIVVRVDGKRVPDMLSLALALRKDGVDKPTVNVDVIREGKQVTVTTVPVKYATMPANGGRKPASN